VPHVAALLKILPEAWDSLELVTDAARKLISEATHSLSEYRDFWELPYDAALKTKLVLALIQARAVLGLVRNLERSRFSGKIGFVIRSDAGASLESIGGSDTDAIVARARSVERAVYEVGASLVPPKEELLHPDAVKPFRPFDVIEAVQIEWPDGSLDTRRILVMLDDAHNLAPEQFELVFRDLARREIRIARWIMMRIDRLKPEIALGDTEVSFEPEVSPRRDYIDIFLNKTDNLQGSRAAFRRMARSMADRYLRRHPVFERRNNTFASLLSTEAPRLPPQTVRRIEDEVEKARISLRIAVKRRDIFVEEIERYAAGAKNQDLGPEVRAVMLRIMMHRYVNQVPQQSLFEGVEDNNPEPRRSMTVDSDIANGARVWLRHNYSRALHYGLTSISDASSENAELFLHLAGSLVDRMEARIINGDQPVLSPDSQDDILTKRAKQIIEEWKFPFAATIRKMASAMAAECVKESVAPNAWLPGGGANAIGVPQEEFSEAIASKGSELTPILHYAVAYNIFLLRQNYQQGGRLWCLLELGGPLILANSLTLNRGGFLQRRIVDLVRYAGVQS